MRMLRAMSWLNDPSAWTALAALTSIEIVLGIDNIIFISILSAKLPARQQRPARRLGLALAMFVRIGLLLSISWIIRLTEPLFAVAGHDFSGRDLTLLVGGLFLLAKSTYEIHDCLEGDEGHRSAQVTASFASVLLQILALDVVFSLDSVITAVGMVEQVGVMDEPNVQVRRLAELAKRAGMDGVVCSAREATMLKEACGQQFELITPGIRPAGADAGDQRRVLTPVQARDAGVDYMVIGRPITQAAEPTRVVDEILQSLA